MDDINEKVICILVEHAATKQIVVDTLAIDNPLQLTLNSFKTFCENESTTLNQIILFIQNTTDLNQLTANYKYCASLHGAYQGFVANNQNTINLITQRQELIQLNQKLYPETYDANEEIQAFKKELINDYEMWGKAFAIGKAYKKCQDNKAILTYSHRLCGWSNPVYQLTPNFSVEIKTNFGYGHASYFYTKLKYKNIEITPFSEWIEYEIAKFSEIVRYTQSHILENKYWHEAMSFSAEACNLSKEDEVRFVEKYVIDECEKMVKGLEDLFTRDQFTFKNKERNQYSVDKKGHVLIEFRGEKISGALDFISKILEYEKIAAIKDFIERIKLCNKKIKPILIDELKIIDIKQIKLSSELKELTPQYLSIVEKNKEYATQRNHILNQMISDKKIDPRQNNLEKLNIAFIEKFPEYVEFEIEYKKVTEHFKILTEQIENLKKVFDNITSYNEKISLYFNE